MIWNFARLLTAAWLLQTSWVSFFGSIVDIYVISITISIGGEKKMCWDIFFFPGTRQIGPTKLNQMSNKCTSCNDVGDTTRCFSLMEGRKCSLPAITLQQVVLMHCMMTTARHQSCQPTAANAGCKQSGICNLRYKGIIISRRRQYLRRGPWVACLTKECFLHCLAPLFFPSYRWQSHLPVHSLCLHPKMYRVKTRSSSEMCEGLPIRRASNL